MRRTKLNSLPAPPGSPAQGLYVVGIGASAGGIQALQRFFLHVPANSGVAYVVVLHLSPDYESKLPEVLQQSSKIPVIRVEENVQVQADHIYVVSPNHHLRMTEHDIVSSPNAQEAERRAPIDIFFRTLADSYGPRAICVVLSGTGANGSMGLKRVKEMGGAVFVQNPREAEFNEMPRNSISTAFVDEILPVAEIPAKVIAYKNAHGRVHIPVDAEHRAESQQYALREVFSHLRLRTGHDFSNYKRPTLLRRIERRINMHNLPDLPAYATFIGQNPEEVTALLKDLLISVTNFFRDKRAFDALEQDIIPAIIQRKKPEDQVRIWVAGCATGEEAYSLAILFAERTLSVIDSPKVQIFATDIDEAAITAAREGLYSLNDTADVSQERMRRFFNKEGESYRIRREVREMILFANHNFLKDPPFSHLDLISCRNVLIYLNQTAQERVLETFHFGLKPNGTLFLGLSESADAASDLYTPYNREFHIFQSRQVPVRAYPVPESVPSFNYNQPVTMLHTLAAPPEYRVRERITLGDLHQRLLEQYAPPSLVVNEEYEILHLSERVGRYLQVLGGEPTQNLLKMIRPELRLELRSALYQAVQRQAAVDARGLRLTIDDRLEVVDIHIRPVLREGEIARGVILVIFEQTARDEEEPAAVVLRSDESVARQLEEELLRLKGQLRISIEQHEFQAEELKASNEELQAMNEELRSAAEELETSKEELQSINEELRTVNQELKVRVDETTLASNNLQNLINSVDIGTIFLDRNFRVVLFTPSACTLFNLIGNDIGRPLSDITNKLEYPDIIADAALVLERLHIVEREVESKEGKIFTMRLLPYRTEEDRINGVVITFFDVTDRRHSEMSLRESEERFRAIVGQTTAGIVQAELSGRFTLANKKFCDILGYTEAELLQKTMLEVTYKEDQRKARGSFERLRTRGTAFGIEKRVVCKDESLRWVNVSVSAIRNSAGKPVMAVAVYQDVTERKALEQQKDEFVAIASHELKTPVTSIKAYAELLEEKFQLLEDPEHAALMQKLNGQVDRLTALIRDLLDTTKITEGKLALNFEKFNVNELIAQRVEELQRLSAKHEIVFNPGRLKAVTADQERIGQVITNLISNAIKYSPAGGKITVMTVPEVTGLRVTVSDTGIGIDDAHKSLVFDRFFRVNHPRVKNSPGMGLGLYISAVIIQRHNGVMGLKSTPGKGSSFHFTLPYTQKKSKA